MITDPKKKWHAVYVSSRTEKKITDLLNNKGIEAYVPIIKTMRQWSDRKKMVELPLLNGYVFLVDKKEIIYLYIFIIIIYFYL